MSENENAAREAAVAEVAEVETVEFEFDGETYTVEKDCGDDAIVIEAIERDHYATVVSRILGPAQWRKFNLRRRRVDALLQMADAIFKAVADGSLGESKG